MSESKPITYLAPLNLTLIADVLRARAVEALEAGDVLGFLSKAEHGNTAWLSIVWQNRAALRERGLYEQALVDALVGTRSNHATWPIWELRWLCFWADPARLRACGDPLPGPGPFTVYRGVAGRGRWRRIRGLSWTLSRGTASWFAQRSALAGLADPAVYRATVRARDVLVYSDDRDEAEVLVALPKRLKVERVLDGADLIAEADGHGPAAPRPDAMTPEEERDKRNALGQERPDEEC